ncbi:MAG: PEP-CTERM sorting domain-containing protein [Planctomycetaceae bacterium]|jgi:hypothetical protein|nr:PEP-CTERM sorting domain-containing protein [Planctomycetaceae bacterium]
MNTFTNFTLAALTVFGTALTANADLVVAKTENFLEGYGTFSSALANVSTSENNTLNGNWSVASLFTYAFNNPGANSATSKSYEAVASDVLKNFSKGLTTKDKNGNAGSSITYGSVKQIDAKDLTTTNGAGTHMDWLTPAVGTNDKGEGLNGYYAFTYTFDFGVIDSISNYENLNVILNLSFGADDHIEGVYLNGQEIKKYLSGYGAENWKAETLLNTSFDASEMAANDGILATGNQLTFIVHNDGHNGQASGFWDGSNALGFGGSGYIALSANANFTPDDFVPIAPGETTATPEPATMLIFGLGIAGAAVARRRRMTK